MDFEKLGLFYFGRPLDPATLAPRAEPLLYDARDLVTHAMIVGMTGSGKTGLGIGLLEEAAIDGVPAVVIDPKGDLANLLLTFPELRPEDFLPWVKEEDAARKGISRDELAAAEAKKWREGLAAWGQDGERIRRLRDAAEVALFTPGSDLGRPLSILSSFAAPAVDQIADGDLFRDRVAATAGSLMALLSLSEDPIGSREHILVASLLDAAWRSGRHYDIQGLIADVQKPPIPRAGVMDIDTFYPPEKRFDLALKLNALIAAPGFDVWLRGTPIDFDALLYTEKGKPRLSILSLAHLTDEWRMFLVTLLFYEAVAWMRKRSGGSSLRALLYMDEVFGYLPPVKNPPSKYPLLTLLKQARAYGLGVVLATQNPVDLDYKALSNMGTWFLGRLQTERDKLRLLDGLEGAAVAASGEFRRKDVEVQLSGLKSRQFLLHNVHAAGPQLFETRWAMSYLAGPIDRSGVRELTRAAAAATPGLTAESASVGREAAARVAEGHVGAASAARPVLDPGVPEVFLAPTHSFEKWVYEPRLLGVGTVVIDNSKYRLQESIPRSFVQEIPGPATQVWSEARPIDISETSIEKNPRPGFAFLPVPAGGEDKRRYRRWEADFEDFLYRKTRVEVLVCKALEEHSLPGESEKDFRIRLNESARAARDREVEKTRAKLQKGLDSLVAQIDRAELRVERERSEASQKKWDSVLSIGSSIAGALLGRRTISAANVSRVGTAARAVGRATRESSDVGRAEDALSDLRERQAALEAEIEAQLQTIRERFDPASLEIESIEIKPTRSDVRVELVTLAWVPVE